jgi:hypothetical protein
VEKTILFKTLRRGGGAIFSLKIPKKKTIFSEDIKKAISNEIPKK